ncbi:MAG: inovirus-type Gp2 protein [Pseudomonadota bacterium]
MYDTVDLALDEYPRLMAVRVDLRFPKLRKNEKSGNCHRRCKTDPLTPK